MEAAKETLFPIKCSCHHTGIPRDNNNNNYGKIDGNNKDNGTGLTNHHACFFLFFLSSFIQLGSYLPVTMGYCELLPFLISLQTPLNVSLFFLLSATLPRSPRLFRSNDKDVKGCLAPLPTTSKLISQTRPGSLWELFFFSCFNCSSGVSKLRSSTPPHVHTPC